MIFCIQASNLGAIDLYEKLGFMKEEKLPRYYLNGGDAFRLKLWCPENMEQLSYNDNEVIDDNPPYHSNTCDAV